MFRLQKCAGLGACYRPEGVWVTNAHYTNAFPAFVTFWFKRKSHFRLLDLTIF